MTCFMATHTDSKTALGLCCKGPEQGHFFYLSSPWNSIIPHHIGDEFHYDVCNQEGVLILLTKMKNET